MATGMPNNFADDIFQDSSGTNCKYDLQFDQLSVKSDDIC